MIEYKLDIHICNLKTGLRLSTAEKIYRNDQDQALFSLEKRHFFCTILVRKRFQGFLCGLVIAFFIGNLQLHSQSP